MSTGLKTPLPSAGVRRPGHDRPFTLTLDLRAPRIVVSLRGSSAAYYPDTRRLLTLGGRRARFVLPVLLELLHRSGFSLPRLEEKGRSRLRLAEGTGARVVLLLWALAPIQKPSRAALVRTGVAAMVEEEVYFWYAKAEGGPTESTRRQRQSSLKALRILLAGD